MSIAAATLASPVMAAAVPLDVSGPVDGIGPGTAVSPASDVAIGASVTVTTENLPDASEAAAWVDDGDFTDETGTYSGGVTFALCGNADSGGALLPAFDPAQHCDGTDLRTETFLVPATATAGSASATLPTRDGNGTFLWDDDGDGATPPITAAAGIGIAQTTCISSLNPCPVLLLDTAGTVFMGIGGFLAAAPVAPVTLAIDGIVGQAEGAQAARGGNGLTVSGTGWDPGLGLAVALCDISDLASCDPSSSTAGLSVDVGGALAGAVPVDTSNTTGLRALKISQPGGQEAAVATRILGPRTVALDPSGGGVSTAVNLTGSGFDPLQAVSVAGSDGVNATTDVGAGVIDNAGNLTGSILVESPATIAIVVTEDDAPTTEGASASFSFATQDQVGEVVVDGTALTLTQTGGLIEMSPVGITGMTQTSTGAIQTVTISDLRGSLSGWSITAVASDWVDVNEPDPDNAVTNHLIPAGNLSWTPSCVPAAGSSANAADVVAGPTSSLDPVAAVTLCSAAPGGGGGVWDAGALLSLTVPGSIAAATYRATLTIVAV